MKKERQNLLKRTACFLTGILLCMGNVALYAEDEETFVLPDSPTPTHAKNEVSYIFSSTYGNVTISQFANKEKATTVGGKSVVKVESNGFLRMNISQVKNVASYTHLHCDVYYVSITGGAYPTIQIKGLDNVGVAKKVDKPLNQWVSYDIPLTDFMGVDLTKINYFEIRGSSGNEFYGDNAYFYNDGDGATSINNLEETVCNIVFASDNISISAENFIENVCLHDIQGKIIRNVAINTNTANINISDLQSGIYILKIKPASGESINKKFIK